MKPRALAQEIQDAFDGTLGEARAAALREILRNSPEALDLFCEQALLEAELHRHAEGRRKIPGMLSARAAAHAAIRRRRLIIQSLAAAAALILIAGLALQLILAPSVSLIVSIESSPGSILLQADGSPVSGTSLAPNQSVTIGQGVVKLRFESGVEAIIEGPANFSLVDKNRLNLDAGHSWFRVPAKEKGFRVVSRHLEVIDLGTEFGVDLRPESSPAVHVFKGRVEATAMIGFRDSLQLGAGRAVSVSPVGRLEAMPADAGLFRTTLPAELPVLTLDFESLESGSLILGGDITGAAASSARLHGSGARLIPGVIGNALQLDGTDAMIESDWSGIAGDAPRTVSLWCRLPSDTPVETAPPFVLWGEAAGQLNRKFKFAPVTLADGKTVLRASFGTFFANGSRHIADDAWHHLALVYRGNDAAGRPLISFFIDGQPDASEFSDALQDAPPGSEPKTLASAENGLTIGRYELSAPGSRIFLKADIDALRIHAGALDDAAISKLASRR